MHKKRAHFLPCTHTKPCYRLNQNTMKRQCARTDAPSLTCRSDFRKVAVFRVNDLSALMLTLGTADFSPPHHSFTVSAFAYLRKTPHIIPYFPPTKNPRQKFTGEGGGWADPPCQRTPSHLPPRLIPMGNGLFRYPYATLGGTPMHPFEVPLCHLPRYP